MLIPTVDPQPATVALFDNLGDPEAWYSSGNKQAQSAPQGNPPGNNDVAMGFEVPADGDFQLDSVDMVLHSIVGPRLLDVFLVADRAKSGPGDGPGEPDMDVVIESWLLENISRDPYGLLVNIPSVTNPVLEAGARYWVVISVPELDSSVAWKAARLDRDFCSSSALHAERNDAYLPGYEWNSFEFEDCGGMAFRVTARSRPGVWCRRFVRMSRVKDLAQFGMISC